MATPIPKNECPFTLDEIACATGGKLFGDPCRTARGVSIDTRTIEPGALFVALRGASGDGHRYLPAALERGAVAAVVERGRRTQGLPTVQVDDTLVALGRLAHHHVARLRSASPIPSIAIGGAAGKTTTKEITAALVRAVFGPTLWTPGNLNNLIGVPMTLFMLTDTHRAMVIECGTNTCGEIIRLGSIVEPDVAMVLNVDIEHTEGLGTLETIADEEAALFSHARRTAVIPAGDSMLVRRVPAHLATVTFGAAGGADVRLVRRTITSRGRARIVIQLAPRFCADGEGGAHVETEIAMLGSAAAINCTAAVAALAAAFPRPLGAGQLGAMERALASVKPVAGRLSMYTVGDVTVIDDTYNSNPRSLRVALEAAREMADGLGARLLVALGDMLELGELAKSAHADAVKDALGMGPAVLVAVGPEMTHALAAARADGVPGATRVYHCADSEEAARTAGSLVRAGDVLLVKGSRGIRMERIVEGLGTDHGTR